MLSRREEMNNILYDLIIQKKLPPVAPLVKPVIKHRVRKEVKNHVIKYISTPIIEDIRKDENSGIYLSGYLGILYYSQYHFILPVHYGGIYRSVSYQKNICIDGIFVNSDSCYYLCMNSNNLIFCPSKITIGAKKIWKRMPHLKKKGNPKVII